MSDLRIGVVMWEPGDGFASDICSTLDALGHHSVPIFPTARLPSDLDLVFLWGPIGSPVPIANQLIRMPPEKRPKLVIWQTEQIWNPDLPAWLGEWLSSLRAWVERRLYARFAGDGSQPVRLLRFGMRFRYYGDLNWLRRHGLPDVLAVPSSWYADRLEKDGFPSVVAYIGAHPGWGADLGLERDIPVLWIGKPGSRRRRRILARVRAELREKGVDMVLVDGVESSYVFGQKRVRLLNRTKIVLNVMRRPWDANAMRYYMAAANRAMILTEPTLPHNPFQPGVHIVEAPIERLADAARYYLDHEEERRGFVDRAGALLDSELGMSGQVQKIVESLPC